MDRPNDLISVIIPVYNVEQYLDRCMQSILNQTYRKLEIILVDDKSSDHSNEMCLQYLYDKRVVLVHGSGEGLSGARNTGLDIANGKYVIFVDSDDYAESTMIENLYNCLVDNDADTVIGGFRRAIGSKIEIRRNTFAGEIIEGQVDINNKVLKKMLASNGVDQIEMSVWKCIFSMDIIQNNNLRFPDKKYLCEDIIFDFAYYPLSKRLAMSEDTGYCYCLNDGSLSQIYQNNKFERIVFQTNEMRKNAMLLELDDESQIRIDNFFVGNTLHHMKTMASVHNIIGRRACIKEYMSIRSSRDMYSIAWNELRNCYKGRDAISFVLFEKKHIYALYIYFEILTTARKVIRK